MNIALFNDAWIVTAGLLLLTLALSFVLTGLARHYDRSNHPLGNSLKTFRDFVVPLGVVFFILVFPLESKRDSTFIRLFETAFWIMVIWVSLTLVKALFFTEAARATWRAKVPELLLDIIRFSMIAVGASLVIAGVWGGDLGGVLATLGVGSIVLGLALQDTLGNLMAGIALLFERPFAVGQWIKVGDTIGVVTEMNWRGVRLETRSLDMVVVPNSVIGKEKIQNFSRPSSAHGVQFELAFAYSDPPNKVKRVLEQVALQTKGILREGISIRTKHFADFSIQYEARVFIDNYEALPEIQQDFYTQLWYALRRNGLTIPFPIRTVYKTEIPHVPEQDITLEIRDALRNVPIFTPLESKELDALAHDALLQEFARGERVVFEGDRDDTLFLIRSGSAGVTVSDSGVEREVARLGKGDFFGEMALLTGEPRSASVTALDDLELIVIYKAALGNLFARRPELLKSIADIIEQRRSELQSRRTETAPRGTGDIMRPHDEALIGRIRRFFGIV